MPESAGLYAKSSDLLNRYSQMVLVRNSRLSVQPVTAEEWRIVCEMGLTAP